VLHEKRSTHKNVSQEVFSEAIRPSVLNKEQSDALIDLLSGKAALEFVSNKLQGTPSQSIG
jgi:hypothetical protein